MSRHKHGPGGIKERKIQAAFLMVYRLDALRDQRGFCLYCYEPLTRHTATTEHREPRTVGGLDRRENIAASCFACNQAKGHMPEAEFIRAITGVFSAPLSILLARFRRRMWLATHRSCQRIHHTVRSTYVMPRGVR